MRSRFPSPASDCQLIEVDGGAAICADAVDLEVGEQNLSPELRVYEIASHVRRAEIPEQAAAFVAKAEAYDTAADAEQEAFSEQQTNQAASTGANGETHRGGGSDSECEGQDGTQGKERRSAQGSEAEFYIAKNAAGQAIGRLFHHTWIRTFTRTASDQDWLRKVKICK
jgi:hypothetical protein